MHLDSNNRGTALSRKVQAKGRSLANIGRDPARADLGPLRKPERHDAALRARGEVVKVGIVGVYNRHAIDRKHVQQFRLSLR